MQLTHEGVKKLPRQEDGVRILEKGLLMQADFNCAHVSILARIKLSVEEGKLHLRGLELAMKEFEQSLKGT